MITIRLAQNTEDLAQVRNIRRTVFIEEQKVDANLEWDDPSEPTFYYLALASEAALATGRYRVLTDVIKFERIATLKEHRGRGIGSALMAHMEEEARKSYPKVQFTMHAQESAVSFYESCGWRKKGERFYEAEIPHFIMLKDT